MKALWQRDPLWRHTKLGTSNVETFGSAGCYLMCWAMLSDKDPRVVNDMFIHYGVYADQCLIVTYKAAQVLGFKLKGQSIHKLSDYPYIAWTHYFQNQGYPQHFFICLDEKTIIDPLDGKTKVNPYPIAGYVSLEKPMDQRTKDALDLLACIERGKLETYRVGDDSKVFYVFHIDSADLLTRVLGAGFDGVKVVEATRPSELQERINALRNQPKSTTNVSESDIKLANLKAALKAIL
jgi:hypothetical protein